jgi:hypothetical protein
MKSKSALNDPIVAEVRRVRSELFAECGKDLRKLFAHLQRQRKARAGNTRRRSSALASRKS